MLKFLLLPLFNRLNNSTLVRVATKAAIIIKTFLTRLEILMAIMIKRRKREDRLLFTWWVMKMKIIGWKILRFQLYNVKKGKNQEMLRKIKVKNMKTTLKILDLTIVSYQCQINYNPNQLQSLKKARFKAKYSIQAKNYLVVLIKKCKKAGSRLYLRRKQPSLLK